MDASPTDRKASRLSRWEPFLLPVTVLAVLGALTWLDARGLSVPGARPVDIVSSLRAAPVASDTAPVVAALVDSTESVDTSAVVEADTANVLPDLSALDTVGVVALESAEALEPFFVSLAAKGRSRVAWFGDSFTEGDILVGDLREFLQKSFGGSGVGLVPPTSPVAKFRGTIKQSFSSDWKERNIMAHGGPRIPVGITGRGSMPKMGTDSVHASWLDLAAADRGGARAFRKLRVFLSGGSDSADSLRAVWEGGAKTIWLGSGALREIAVDLPEVERVRVSFQVRDTLSVEAVELEASKTGVTIDNLSIRGNSGMGILQIPSENLSQMHRKLGYSLVVLQFGANVADTSMTGYGWYRDRLAQVVERIHSVFPGAAVLLVGVGDRGVRGADGRIVSHPSMASIVSAQRAAAERTGSAFWDMRQAMGGENSMAKWSAAGLCAADYTHISPQGGRRLAKALNKSILMAWSKRETK
ncbi:MAG: hypothetical protein IPK50_01500 [Fibrobacterota bacterium]|nr:MAG: hypothetical protein IPK50_01500 [Fibrobacterota bacterium]